MFNSVIQLKMLAKKKDNRPPKLKCKRARVFQLSCLKLSLYFSQVFQRAEVHLSRTLYLQMMTVNQARPPLLLAYPLSKRKEQ